MDLITKVTIFCRELGEDTLRDLVRKQNKEKLLQHAQDALKAGRIGTVLEADLDALHSLVKEDDGRGLFPVARRFSPLPPYPAETGTQWWTCPRSLCAGRGRVRPGQQPPKCAVTSEELIAGPLPE